MSLTLRYYDVPYGAQEDARAYGPGQSFAQAQQTVQGTRDTAYATLEKGGWPLDGSRRVLEDTPVGMGWWSDLLSDEKGVFVQPPVLEFRFSAPYSATGLTFTFWPSTDEWCSRLRISWYNANTLLAQSAVEPDRARWTLAQTVEGFDLIRVELLATNRPGRFAKVQRVEFGQTIWFEENALESVSMVNEADPTLSVLSVDTMTVQLRERQSRDLLPQRNQSVELYRDGRLIAVQFINQCTRQAGGGYTLSCQSAIGLLEDMYLGGLYENVSARTLVEEVLGGWEYEMDETFADTVLTGYLPVCTRREALQQIAFAMGALVTTQGGKVIRILALPGAVTANFGPDRVFQGACVETMPKIAAVALSSHSYTPLDQVETLVDEALHGENILITFHSPHHSYEITGGTIVDSGVNHVRICADGAVALTGKAYLHNVVCHTRHNPTATAAERNNLLTVEDATLVSSTNAEQVISRLYTAGLHRQKLRMEARVDGHVAGQRVTAVSPWGTQLRGTISSMESQLTQNGHTATVCVLGMEVPAKSVYSYAGQLYSGGQEVLY